MKLLKVMEDINTIYLSLFSFEKFNDRENGYFFELVNDLKVFLIKEENIFNDLVDKLGLSYVKEVLVDEKGPISNRIKSCISRYEDKNTKDTDEFNDDEKMVCDVRMLYKTCTRNIFLVYLSYLQEYIDTTEDKVMREKLLNLKYYDAFIKLEIGEILINNDFYIGKTNYVDLYLVADLLRMKNNITYEMIADAHWSALKEMITQLFSIDDDKYSDYNIVVASKNVEFMIRACLSIINDKEFDYIQDEIFLLIDELSTDDNEMAFNIMDRVLEERNRDKCRVMKISLRPINN